MFINEPQFEVEHVTKRTLLSDITKIFDPMGFLSPLTILWRFFGTRSIVMPFELGYKVARRHDYKVGPFSDPT